MYTCSHIGELTYNEGSDRDYDEICNDAVALCRSETKGSLQIGLKGSAKDYLEQETHPFDLLHIKDIQVSQLDRNEAAICPGCLELRSELKTIKDELNTVKDELKTVMERHESNHELGDCPPNSNKDRVRAQA